jgi:hypothetical protein
MQGKQLRQNLQSTILTMTAGPYKEASFVFKSFQPPEVTKKRTAQTEAECESPTNRNRGSSGNGGNGTTTTNNRIPRRNPTSSNPTTNILLDNIATPTTTQGKTILKQLATDSSAKLLHPGPIFPHPSRPNKFTLLCCRSAYEGKTCTYPTCNFFHFPNNLANSVSNEIKAKMVTWVNSQAAIEWTSEVALWATPAGNSTQSTTNSSAP